MKRKDNRRDLWAEKPGDPFSVFEVSSLQYYRTNVVRRNIVLLEVSFVLV